MQSPVDCKANRSGRHTYVDTFGEMLLAKYILLELFAMVGSHNGTCSDKALGGEAFVNEFKPDSSQLPSSKFGVPLSCKKLVFVGSSILAKCSLIVVEIVD